jgi:hypothetical protein
LALFGVDIESACELDGRDANALALTTTSRQLYAETKLLPFVLGQVLAYPVRSLVHGIKDFGPEQRQAIRNFELSISDVDTKFLRYADVYSIRSGNFINPPSLQKLIRPVLDKLPGVKDVKIYDETRSGAILKPRNESTAETSDVNIVVKDGGY